LAELAVEWLATQLARPVKELSWIRDGQIDARRWELADTGHIIDSEGRIPLRARKRPDRVECVRPPSDPS